MARIIGTPNDDTITLAYVSVGVTGGRPTRNDDIVFGREGDDLIEGGGGDDGLNGQAGDDRLNGGPGQDTLDGGSGNDTADYSYSASNRLRIDLSEGFAWFVEDPSRPPGPGHEPTTTEPLIRIENAIGSRGNTVIIGNERKNVLIGDGLGIDTDAVEDRVILSAEAGNAEGSEAGESDHILKQFNDHLFGYGGNDTLIGDVLLGSGSLSARAGNGGDGYDYAAGGSGGNRNTINVFNDRLDAGDGDDTVVGGVLLDNGNAELTVAVGTGGEADPEGRRGVGGDRNDVKAFNDTIDADEGDDTVVGDAVLDTGNAELTVAVGTGGEADTGGRGGAGGTRNKAEAFNDTIDAGEGDDTVVGDVSLVNGSAELTVAVGSGGYGSNYFRAGAGGDNNTAKAFVDTLRAGSGNDTLVGDARLDGKSGVILNAAAGKGGDADFYTIGGPAGDNNQLLAFNDTMDADAGDDTAIGDVFALDKGTVALSAVAGSGGSLVPRSSSGQGGRGGGDNTVASFNDTIDAGAGDDIVVGDVYALKGGTITLNAAAGSGGSLFEDRTTRPGSGGDANTVRAFNDILYGGGGDDALVGDVSARGAGSVALSVDAGGGTDAFPDARDFEQYGQGGNGNSVLAFSDKIDAGEGDNTVVGDVSHSSNGDVDLSVKAGLGGDAPRVFIGLGGVGNGGNDNTICAFEDRITSGKGNDRIVGDVAHAGRGDVTLDAAVGIGGDAIGTNAGNAQGGNGGSNNRAEAFNDEIGAGSGNDTVVGDVSHAGSGVVSLSAIVSHGGYARNGEGGSAGNANRAAAFNDTISAGLGNDTVVGDVAHSGNDDVSLDALAGIGGAARFRAYGGDGGSNSRLAAFNDDMDAGSGNDSIVGDVAHLNDGTISLSAGAGNGGSGAQYAYGGVGGSDNRLTAFNDKLDAGAGNDTIVGDATHSGSGNASLSVIVGGGGDQSVSGVGRRGGIHNTLKAFNDTIDAGSGDDTITGDVAHSGRGEIRMTVLAAAGGKGSYADAGRGGANNQGNAFNDTIEAAGGDDAIAGDVVHSGDGTIILTAAVAAGGNGRVDGIGGRGGSTNTVNAFSDHIDAGSGNDRIVGDATHAGEGTLTLAASAGDGGTTEPYDSVAGAGGNGNTLGVFNDDLKAGSGTDTIVGDIARSGSGDVNLRTSTGTGGGGGQNGSGGDGGNDNTGKAFSDTIDAGSGNDTIVGDVSHSGDRGTIALALSAGTEGASDDDGEGGSGGTGNTVAAFNDTIAGGDGNDVIVGDVWRASDDVVLDIAIAGEDENTIEAFQDDISGGAGNDTIYGDFFNGTNAFVPDSLTIEGGFRGRSALFADTLNGGAGDDFLNGGLGDDRLIGDAGNDTFVFTLTSGGARDTDRIVDFDASADRIDLTAFAFGGFDEVDSLIRQRGDDGFLDLASVGGPGVILEDVEVASLTESAFLL